MTIPSIWKTKVMFQSPPTSNCLLLAVEHLQMSCNRVNRLLNFPLGLLQQSQGMLSHVARHCPTRWKGLLVPDFGEGNWNTSEPQEPEKESHSPEMDYITNRKMDKWVHQWVNQWVNRWVNRWINQRLSANPGLFSASWSLSRAFCSKSSRGTLRKIKRFPVFPCGAGAPPLWISPGAGSKSTTSGGSVNSFLGRNWWARARHINTSKTSNCLEDWREGARKWGEMIHRAAPSCHQKCARPAERQGEGQN